LINVNAPQVKARQELANIPEKNEVLLILRAELLEVRDDEHQ
jgi:hypothetical protein